MTEPAAEFKPIMSVHKIGELAELTQTTTRTLRYYEELGLLQPLRNNSGQRLYGQDAITQLHFINELKAGGFSLLEIKNFFESWRNQSTGGASADATIPLVQQKLVEINDLQKKLARLHDELRAMVTFIVACRPCDQKPTLETCKECERHTGPLDPTLERILKGDSASL